MNSPDSKQPLLGNIGQGLVPAEGEVHVGFAATWSPRPRISCRWARPHPVGRIIRVLQLRASMPVSNQGGADQDIDLSIDGAARRGSALSSVILPWRCPPSTAGPSGSHGRRWPRRCPPGCAGEIDLATFQGELPFDGLQDHVVLLQHGNPPAAGSCSIVDVCPMPLISGCGDGGGRGSNTTPMKLLEFSLC